MRSGAYHAPTFGQERSTATSLRPRDRSCKRTDAVAHGWMKVLLVSHYTLPHVGGIEVLVDQHSQHLAQRGHDVTVLSSRVGAPAEERRGAVRVVRVAAWNFLERWLDVP